MKTESRIQEIMKSSLLYEDKDVISSKSITERIEMLQHSLTEIFSELQSLNKSEYKSLLKQGQILLLVENRIKILDNFVAEIKSVTKQLSNGDLDQIYRNIKEEQTKLTKLYNILAYLDGLE